MATTYSTTGFDQHAVAMPRDYFMLLKPRVMSLVIFTAFVGMWLAPDSINPTLGVIALLTIAIGAGASGALNMWFDADIDAIMTRTATRPIPSGAVSGHEALVFGVVLSGFAVVFLGLFANWLAAGLLAFTIFFYAVIYTMWLKRSTPQNIVIGGAAGAFPPVIGWAAVTGTAPLDAWLLFLIIFLWTPPHFWALALVRSSDYARAGVPMMPNVAGIVSTNRQIFFYSLLLAIAGLLPWLLGNTGIIYGICAMILGSLFAYRAFAVLRMAGDDEQMLPARKLFGFSIFYLFALFLALLVDSVLSGVWLNA
jgi:heme o synthase